MRRVTSLREWLDHLAAHDRLAVIRPGVAGREVLGRFAQAAANPLPWRETTDAPVQEVEHAPVDLLA